MDKILKQRLLIKNNASSLMDINDSLRRYHAIDPHRNTDTDCSRRRYQRIP